MNYFIEFLKQPTNIAFIWNKDSFIMKNLMLEYQDVLELYFSLTCKYNNTKWYIIKVTLIDVTEVDWCMCIYMPFDKEMERHSNAFIV